MVIGLGGYSSVPPLVAARLLGVPYIILEQNVVPGKANRLMARWAKGVYTHWEQSFKRFNSKARIFEATGTPIRKGILNMDRERAAKTLRLSTLKKTILVMGGSQGAKAINEVIIQCLPKLEEHFQALQIIHCTGESDYERVRASYGKTRIDAFVCGFLDDMGVAYSLADLVICRAGATTIAEVTAIGIPAVFVPYPYASENHQYWNAKAIAVKGGGVIIEEVELTTQSLLKVMSGLLQDDKRRLRMKNVSKSLGKPDAAAAIVNSIFRTVERNTRKSNKSLLFPLFLTAWARRP
jgi:UDP-N-acetylglucosamine--N-acetylmuramyl-(pentapeptide) pyrophosphoryl-undecaprenol N-acetylglucosamine transferase